VNIDHYEFSKALAGANRRKHVLPVLGSCHLKRLHRLDIYNVHRSRYLINQDKRPDAPKELLLFRRQNHEVVSADGRKFAKVGVLVVVLCVLFIVGDQLLRVFIAAHKVVLDELNQPVGVTVRLKLEIQAVSRLLDSDRLLVSLVLENHLLQEQKSALVVYPLANLHLADPVVGRPCLLAIVALFVLHNELHSECLL